MIYERVALIGLGLIASSMAHAMRRGGLAGEIVGTSRSAETRAEAEDVGFCDRIVETAAEAVQDADLVVLAVPVGAMEAVAREIGPHLKPGATVTDVGSVKRAVIEGVAPHLPDNVHFVPAHPMAGTEHSGPRSGFAELFDNRWTLIVPPEGTDAEATAKLVAFWESLGANTEVMDVDHHDLVCAIVSHIPHLIAYTMVGVADDFRRVQEQEVIKFSAAGFRDFTRIAASDPTMWRDVFLNNKDATLEILGRFTEELFALQRAIRTGDGNHLHDYFTRTRAIRRGIIEAEGFPTGEVTVRAEEWRKILDMAVASGVLPENAVGPVERALELMSGPRDTLDATISFRGGLMWLGIVPIGPAPRIVIR